jgi:RNA polymerase sigma factor (sigma-70 family)
MTLETLYKEYSKMVYNLCLQYLQNTEDAEEVCQDVFIQVHQHLSSFKHESTPSTWIYRITINKCLDVIKAKKRKKRFAFLQSIFKENSLEIKYETKEFNHPGILLENKEALEIVFKCLNLLKEEQKTALILHKIEKLSQQEIAEIMNLSRKAVESLVQRAKQNLKKLLENEGIQF